ncbi:MAG: carboxypeptidase-like regulatory domain-containing protein, partial [Candidatus Altiarchaeota archaeon]
EDYGVSRLNEPVSVNLSSIFGKMNLSAVDAGSLRLVDPEKKRIGEVNGHAITFQLDDDGDGKLSGADILSFLAEANSHRNKTYYLYYAGQDSGIENQTYESDLSFEYDGGKTIIIENEENEWEGFSTGYFTLYRYEPKKTKDNLAYPPLGLDHGYIIESAKTNESFVRYDSDWTCNLDASGPILVKITCKSSSQNFDVSKTMTFYAKNTFYETENKITKKNNLLSNVKWVIYNVVKPYFINQTGRYSLSTQGTGAGKITHLTALESPAGDHSLKILAKGDVSLYFEDRDKEYDLFGETIYMSGLREQTSIVRHIYTETESEDEARQYPMFAHPLTVRTGNPDENKLEIKEPDANTVYDIAYENTSNIKITASIGKDAGTSKIECNITDNHDKIIYQNITLVNDGTHGDETPGDDTWTNNDSTRLYSKDATGRWGITCTENGSQTHSTTTENEFYVVSHGGYRRIEFFNIYCKSGEHFKSNPAKVRPGSFAELHICLMNTGTQDEENVRVSMPAIPRGWRLEDVFIEKLGKGKEIPAVMKLHVPEGQSPVSEKLKIDITSDGTITGSDYLIVDVVYPKIDATATLAGESLIVKTLDSGAPIPDAQVRLTYASGKIQSAKTDTEGLAQIPAIDAGEVLVTVSKTGYNATQIRLTVSETAEEQSMLWTIPVLVLIAITIHYTRTHNIDLKNILKRK